MIRQVVLTEEEYAEIEQIKIEHNEMKIVIGDFDQVKKVLVEHEAIQKQLIELQNMNDQFEKFKETVANMFLNDKGDFSYHETGQHYSNKLFVDSAIVAELFNQFF